MAHSNPPRIDTPIAFVFPEYKHRTLSGGMKIIAVEDRTQPLVSINLALKQGAALEKVWGAANFASSLLTKGTMSRSAQDIADAIDFTGGSLNASSGFDSASMSISILSQFLPNGLELLADVLLHPAFAEDEIERLRQQTLVEIQQYLSDAGYLAAIAFTQGMFRGTPYGHPTIGTTDTVQRMSRQDCEDIYHLLVRPDQAFIAAAGDFDTDELVQTLEGVLGHWSASTGEKSSISATHEQITNNREAMHKVMLIEKPDAAQTALRLGFQTVGRENEDFIAMQFLNTILGGSFISRLNHNLREEKGYTYGIHSGIDTYKQATIWAAKTHVGSEVAGDAVREILREIDRMATEPISDDELETTRKYLLGSFALRTETPQQVVSLVSALEMFNLPDDYYQRYFAEVAAMTKEHLFTVQQRRFAAQNLVIAASGSVEHLRSQLGELGAASVVSMNGEILSS